MSSIRLFILSSFATHGEMHGHQVRAQAEQEYVHLWTDISVGSVYGAIKRLAGEGLLKEVRNEQDGNRPARQIYAVTAAGRNALAELRQQGLQDIWLKPDPFDLALTRVAPDTLADLPEILSARLAAVRDLLEQTKRVNADALEHVSASEKWALRHTEYRLQAEVAWLEDLIAAAPDIVADEQSGMKPTRGQSAVAPAVRRHRDRP